MKPRRTVRSNHVLRLPGGTEDNDLWCEVIQMSTGPIVSSTWELTDEDRQAIAAGANVELLVWGGAHPPVAIRTTDVTLGAAPKVAPE